MNGTYGCGETVTFCFTVTFWNSTNANWFQGIVANFGPGWDLSTLTPGAPPASCSGSGTWGWYPSVQGTAATNVGPQGPGFFYDYNPPDGNPGNNFGDFCTGVVNWSRHEAYLRSQPKWKPHQIASVAEESLRIISKTTPISRPEFQCRGLVVGYVQSGKTATSRLWRHAQPMSATA